MIKLLPMCLSVAEGVALRASSAPAEVLAGLIDGANKHGASPDPGAQTFRDAFAESLGGAPPDAGVSSHISALIEGVADDADLCVRDWSAPCPSGWAPFSHQGRVACERPRAYDGGCAAIQSFVGENKAARARFAAECDAPWPCAGSCAEGTDFDGCPVGWTNDGDGFCSATTAVANPACATTLNFAEMAVREKEEFAHACSAEWPCKAR